MGTKFYKFLILIFSVLSSSIIYSQGLIEKEGSVSYISSQNIYVKFLSTDGISKGDTLFLKTSAALIPAVKVKFLSSSSAAGERIGSRLISLNDKLTAFLKEKQISIPVKKDSGVIRLEKLNSRRNGNSISNEQILKNYKSKDPSFTGRVSIQSYSGLSNYTEIGDFQRWRYNLSFFAKNISDSKISFSNYVSYSYRANDWQNIKNNLMGNIRIYDFAANYQFTKNANIWVGRHLNSKITNISSIDGLQFESNITGSNYSYGFAAGSRPDFANMGFNIKLFEFGGYISRTDSAPSGLMENTLAVMEQTNDLKVDRRFLYFQHSSNLINNLNLFLSSEIDLYKKENGKSTNDFSLTGLYFSARYSPVRLFSFLLSYDARKNVIYYETFKSFIETLMENETRQGLRGSISLRPFNRMFINISSGYRFSKSDPKPSKNYSVYISYSEIPVVKITPSCSVTKLLTSYADGTTEEVRISKNIDMLNSDLSLGYQRIDYSFIYSRDKLKQNVFSADMFIRILKKLYLNFDYEGTFQNNNTDSRIILGLTQRF